MPKFNDLKNMKFGRWSVISLYSKASRKVRRTLWNCRCDCGNIGKVRADQLKNGHSASCGCLCKEINILRNKKLFTKHGHSINQHQTRAYRAWIGMRRRCQNPNNKWYGGRGIFVCERWRDFQTFLTDMGIPPSPKHSIDRINPNGNYEPSNCRWATHLEQMSNTRSNILILFDRKTKTLAEWSRVLGIKYATLYARIYIYLWPIEKAMLKFDGRK